MTDPKMPSGVDEYAVRASAYRLLAGLLSDPAAYQRTVEALMADTANLRATVDYLVGMALGGYVQRHNGDVSAALVEVRSELQTASDLASLSDPQE